MRLSYNNTWILLDKDNYKIIDSYTLDNTLLLPLDEFLQETKRQLADDVNFWYGCIKDIDYLDKLYFDDDHDTIVTQDTVDRDYIVAYRAGDYENYDDYIKECCGKNGTLTLIKK